MTFNVHDVPNVKSFMLFRNLMRLRQAIHFYSISDEMRSEIERCLITLRLPDAGEFLMLPTIRPTIEDTSKPSFPRYWRTMATSVYYYNEFDGMKKDYDMQGFDLSKSISLVMPNVEKYFDKLMGRQAAHRSGV